MPWIRLSDNYMDDEKIRVLSDGAFRLWHEGMAYCRRNQTDGLIPFAILRDFLAFTKGREKQLSSPAREGLSPLWVLMPGMGYRVSNYLKYNLSKEEESDKRSAANARMKKFRAGDASHALTGDAEVLGTDMDRIGKRSLPEKGSGEKPSGPTGAGVLTGALPREHLNHAECDPTFARCVPAAVHGKLKGLLAPKFGGDRDLADCALRDWYPTVWASLAPDFVMGDAFKFWQPRFDAAFASLATPAKDYEAELRRDATAVAKLLGIDPSKAGIPQ
jgi:hypothetical protein